MGHMLKNVTNGRQRAPLRELVYGIQGVGKTSFGAGAPSPIFLGEDGTKQLDVARFPVIRRWDDVTSAIADLRLEKHNYETLCVDTLDHLEPVLWRYVAGDDDRSIEDVGGGYGKGYTKALEAWHRFLVSLEQLQEAKGMNVILLAHAATRKHKDPIEPEYDRFSLKINEKASAAVQGWVNSVLFAAYRTTVSKTGRGKVNAARATAFERILFTQRIPAADAKNRYDLPPEIEFSFRSFWEAANRPEADRIADKRAEAERLLELVRSEESRARGKKALELAGSSLEGLRTVIARLEKTLNSQDEQAAAENNKEGASPSANVRVETPAAAPSLISPKTAGQPEAPPSSSERKPTPAANPQQSKGPGEAVPQTPPQAVPLAKAMAVPAGHDLAPDDFEDEQGGES